MVIDGCGLGVGMGGVGVIVGAALGAGGGFCDCANATPAIAINNIRKIGRPSLEQARSPVSLATNGPASLAAATCSFSLEEMAIWTSLLSCYNLAKFVFGFVFVFLENFIFVLYCDVSDRRVPGDM